MLGNPFLLIKSSNYYFCCLKETKSNSSHSQIHCSVYKCMLCARHFFVAEEREGDKSEVILLV